MSYSMSMKHVVIFNPSCQSEWCNCHHACAESKKSRVPVPVLAYFEDERKYNSDYAPDVDGEDGTQCSA